MKKIIIFGFFLNLFLSGCVSKSVKEAELELKQRELLQRENEVAIKEASLKKMAVAENKKSVTQKTQNKRKKKLRYLYYTSVGLKGYFNDGAILECAGCELAKENLQNFNAEKPVGSYTVQNGYLLVNGKDREYLTKNETGMASGWAMINYKWVVVAK